MRCIIFSVQFVYVIELINWFKLIVVCGIAVAIFSEFFVLDFVFSNYSVVVSVFMEGSSCALHLMTVFRWIHRCVRAYLLVKANSVCVAINSKPQKHQLMMNRGFAWFNSKQTLDSFIELKYMTGQHFFSRSLVWINLWECSQMDKEYIVCNVCSPLSMFLLHIFDKWTE